MESAVRPTARRLGDGINRIYNQLLRNNLVPTARVPPPVRYAVRAALGDVLIRDADALPSLRPDVASYADRFAGASGMFESLLTPFTEEIAWPTGRVFNGLFDTVDAYLYYAVLRTYRPSRVIEIGTGNSAWFAAEALRRNGRGSLLVIDPQPMVRPPRGVEWLPSRVEDVSLERFAPLRPGDVLFIDSSHRKAEVQYHRDRILPSLPKGMLVHVHDFYFPFDSAYAADPRRFEETQAWLELISAPDPEYRVLTCAPFVRHERPDLLTRLVPPYERTPHRVPGSLWMEKTAGAARAS